MSYIIYYYIAFLHRREDLRRYEQEEQAHRNREVPSLIRCHTTVLLGTITHFIYHSNRGRQLERDGHLIKTVETVILKLTCEKFCFTQIHSL